MSGITSDTPIPNDLVLHQKTRMLEIRYASGDVFNLPCEYLRVYSPSAEVRGHAAAQAKLESGKQAVTIQSISPVGNYAIQFTFSDGHTTGIYSWDYLYRLAMQQDAL